jgi:uncharacterized repeat protein (TIGR01451 family)
MSSPRLGRLIFLALIAGILLFLKPDQIREPLLNDPSLNNNKNKDINYSLTSITRDKKNIDLATRTRIEQSYGKLPMRFEANHGQTDARVKFTSRGAGYAVFLTDDETVLQLRKGERASGKMPEQKATDQPVESAVLRMKLVGSNRSSRISGMEKMPTTSNYFIGDDPAAWRRGISNYSKIKYESVYPGIDLVWYGNQQLLEHDFLIAPGADASRIKFSFSGTNGISIDDEGALVLQADGEDLRLLKPVAWQESEGDRQTIACDYRLGEKNQVEFRLGDYDPKLPLVIDPVLIYSTYIGGIGADSAQEIAVDAEGAAYITGQTDSADFPGPSPIQPARGTFTDAYVLKINPAGDAIVFGTWIGGNGIDSAIAVSVDPAGNVYVAGTTSSQDFPLQNPLQNTRRGSADTFAAKIDSSGSALLYSTYIGGTGIDNANALAVGGDGNLYLSGTTNSLDFPVINAFQPVKSGSGAYTSDNGGESWSDIRNGLDVEASNDIVIFPGDSSTIFAGTDRGVFKTTDRGGSWNLLGGDQFIRSINQIIVAPTTTDVLYAVSSGQLFKSIDGGATWSPLPISLVRTAAIDPTNPSMLYAGTTNGLSISLNGGDSWTPVSIPPNPGGTIAPVDTISIDPTAPATVYLSSSQWIYKSIDRGATWTIASNGLPNFTPAIRFIRIAISRSNPATIYVLDETGILFKTTTAAASWSSVLGPAVGPSAISQPPLPLAVAPDNSDVVYVGSRSSGLFRSNNGGITWNTINNGLHGREIRAVACDPNSPGRAYAGAYTSTDVFAAKIDPSGSTLLYSTYIGGGATDNGGAIAIDSSGAAYLAGLTNSPNFPVVNPIQAATTGLPDAFIVKINASGSAVLWATYLGGSNFDNATGIAVSATGGVFVAGTTTSSDFPVNNAIQSSLNGFQDGYIARLKNDGSAFDFSTYLGGTSFDSAIAIAVDSAGNPYVTGTTNSPDFPVISAIQSALGIIDAFVTKLNALGSAFVYSTYLGGSGSDTGSGIAVDAAGNAYVTGITFSNDFPTTPSPIRLGGPSDSFVSKLGASADLEVTLTGTPNPVMINKELTYSLVVINNGSDLAVSARVTNTLPAGVSPVSTVTSQGSCTGTREIECELGNLAAGSSATITIIVTPSNTGTITSNASATSVTPDIDPSNNTAALATVVSPFPSIYGRITEASGSGLSGVTVAVDGSDRPPAVTSDDGNYQVSKLAVGRGYTVTPSRQGYVFNPPSRTINNIQSDRRADFGAVACNLSISSASQVYPVTGGIGSIKIASPSVQCAWTATSNAPWIHLISAPAGNGNAIVRFEIEPTTLSRGGSITINDTTIVIFQEFNACSTVTFNNPKIRSVNGIQPSATPAFVVGDFNNDSVSDLVSRVSQPVAGLSIATSNSIGEYDDARMIYTGDVHTIRAGELNNDGMEDLVLITNDSPARLLVQTGNGAGEFSAPSNIETGPSPTALTIADFNNDGRSDLVVGTASLTLPSPNYNLAIHPGDGLGGFAPPMNFSFTTRPGSFPSQIEAGDFNGDGSPDFAVLGNTGPALIFTGNGSGGFTISTLNIPLGGVMATGDFNGDMKTDLAISQRDSAGRLTILLWISTAAGMLQPAQPINSGSGSLRFGHDFNSDGKSDLLLSNVNEISVLYALNDGNFTEPKRFLPGGSNIFHALGDFKSDGQDLRSDLFVILQSFSFGFSSVNVAILTSDALTGFDAPRAFNFAPSQGGSFLNTAEIESGDLNGDGVLDLVIASINTFDAIMMFGNASGEFSAPVSIDSGIPFGTPNAVEIRDFNRDEKLDLALLNTNSQNLSILLGNGEGGFTPSATLSTGVFARKLESADFNNDGNFDLVTKAQSGGLVLFLGNGQGGFTEGSTGIGGSLDSITFTTGDFNGDGNTDLAFSDDNQFIGAKLIILSGNGQGGFGEPINVSISFPVGHLTSADLNFDGRDDLAYRIRDFGTAVTILLSNPGGSFAAPVDYPIGQGVGSPTLIDINGDGKLDLIATNSGASGLSILSGNGDGTFNQAVNFRVIDAPNTLEIGDFDNDGRIDIAFTRSSLSIVGILRNTSMCVP